jgi:hypothetical protein
MGEDDQDAVMLNVLMGLTKGVGVCFGMLTVDRVCALSTLSSSDLFELRIDR